MKKKCLIWYFVLFGSFCAFGAAKAKVTFRVVNDFGQPVEDAPVTLLAFDKWVPEPGMTGTDKYKEVSGRTNEEGIVVLSIRSKEASVKYGIYDKNTSFSRVWMNFGEGDYYRNEGGRVIFTEEKDGEWFRWNEIVEIVIKPVLDPIPMYACNMGNGELKVPVLNESVAYDLMKSDWLPPYGDGEVADFVFQINGEILGYRKMDRMMMLDSNMRLTFTNEGDGIQEISIKPRKGSVLKLPRRAPEEGYIPELNLKSYSDENKSFSSWNENQNYFFRVRTKKDEEGNIVSAIYGKLDGPIIYGVRETHGKIGMVYYLNPTPNDRNLEFDVTKNLFDPRKVRAADVIQRP